MVEYLSAQARLAQMVYEDYEAQDHWKKREAEEARMRKIDPCFQFDYTGTNYYVMEVERGSLAALQPQEQKKP